MARLYRRQTPLQRRAVTPPVEDDDDDLHVRFAARDQVFSVRTALSCLESLDQRRQLWYNREDIQAFRRDAQITSKKLREGNRTRTRPLTTMDGDDDKKEEEETICTRGLELRASPQRQDRKQQVVRRILDAQDSSVDSAEEMARIAREHGVVSRKLAQAQAHQDYYAAYHPHLVSAVTTSTTSACVKPHAVVGHKRPLWGSSPQQPSPVGRRVRCRMY